MSAALERRRFTVSEFVQLGEMGILRPDEHVELIAGEIVVMSPERFALSPQGPVHSGVAAVSSHAYDRGVKANLYARAGVIEYCVLDVPGRRMEAFREPSDHGYRTVRFLTEEDRILPVAAASDSTEGLAISELLPPVRSAAPVESHG